MKKPNHSISNFKPGQDAYEARISWIRKHPCFEMREYKGAFKAINAVVYSELGKLVRLGVLVKRGEEYALAQCACRPTEAGPS